VPKLVCRACFRQIYATAPIESLFVEERRCSRCGAGLFAERRLDDRRQAPRRVNPAHDPGPPADSGERRTEADRREVRRRAGEGWTRR
jgi:hypothetical protein